jgi:hypothetical protein
LGQLAAGSDSVLLTRPGITSDFKANLGIVVTVGNQEHFAAEYTNAVAKAYKNNGVSRKRPLARAADIRYLCDSDAATAKVIQDILGQVSEEINQIHAVYTLIFPSKVKEVYVYSAEPPIERISPVDFQDKLANPYAYLSLWAYSKCLPGLKRPLLTDSFSGETTIAWRELSPHTPKMYFDGANTNPIVSIADLLIRLLNTRFEATTEKLANQLDRERLPDFLPELSGRVETFYLGQKFLKEISPLTRERIDISPFVAHPVIFIVKEPTSVQTPDFITRAPVMDAVFHVALQLGGCTKFFEPSSDQKLIQPHDWFLWTGELGKRFVESLPGMGYTDLRMGSIDKVAEITV